MFGRLASLFVTPSEEVSFSSGLPLPSSDLLQSLEADLPMACGDCDSCEHGAGEGGEKGEEGENEPDEYKFSVDVRSQMLGSVRGSHFRRTLNSWRMAQEDEGGGLG